jgi:hypothetical protein
MELVTLVIGLIGGFLLGIIASTIAWVISEHLARPVLDVVVDQGRAQGQVGENPPHQFYHVRVTNIPSRWPVPGRRPAWACRAIIEVFRQDGSRAINEDIVARWTSQPEPLVPVVSQGQVGNVVDFARVMQGRTMDVHGHRDELIPVVIKYEGEADCYIFTNESYLYPPRMQNPAWRLPLGRYRIRVTVHYAREPAVREFELRNEGTSRDSVCLVPHFATEIIPEVHMRHWNLPEHLRTLLEIFYALAIASGMHLVAHRVYGEENWTFSWDAASFVVACLIALGVGIADWLNSFIYIRMEWRDPGKVVMELLFPLLIFSFFASAQNIVLFSSLVGAYAILAWFYFVYCNRNGYVIPAAERQGRLLWLRSPRFRGIQALILGILALLQFFLWCIPAPGRTIEVLRAGLLVVTYLAMTCFLALAWWDLWNWLQHQLRQPPTAGEPT